MEKIILTQVPLSELEERLAIVFEEKLSSYIQKQVLPQTDAENEYLTRKEVSKKLRISLPTLNSLTKEGVITGYRIGTRVLYKWDEVESVLKVISSNKYKRKDSISKIRSSPIK